MKFTLKEMQGLLNGKCLPSDLIVGETLAEYLVRKFDELEQKLAESQREFRAADATIENLQMQVEKLAAENGQMLRLLTDISENHDEYVNQDEYLYAGVPMDYVSEINAYVSRDVEAENPFKETDAFLAEVRASAITDALESLDGVFDTDCVMESNGISYEDAEQRTARAYAVSKALEEFAAQLRKGAAQ